MNADRLGSRPKRLLVAALALPLVALPLLAYVVLSPAESVSSLRLAPGGPSSGLHPVAGSFVADSTGLEECGDRFSCLEQAFGNVAYREGPRRALELFVARIEQDIAVERDCHRIAHVIGSAALARFGGDVPRAFAAGNSACASGYYHGILERAFSGVASSAQLSSRARTLCTGAGIRRRGFLDYQCRHGLGHGLMIQTGYDLPVALSLCSSLGTRWDEVTCTSGAFMENVSTRFGFRSRWLDDDDALDPCPRLPVRWRRSCYVRASTRALDLNGHDFADAADACLGAGAPWSTFCFRGFGRDAVVENRYVSVEGTLALCDLAGRFFGQCLYGAARTFADGSGRRGAARAARLCALVARGVQDECASGLGVVVGLLHPTNSVRGKACRALVPAATRACVDAAIAEVDPSGRGAWG